VTVLELEAGEAKTDNNDLDPGSSYHVDKTVKDVSADDFDGLVIPEGHSGGGETSGRCDDSVHRALLLRTGKAGRRDLSPPLVARLLVEADVLKGRTITSLPTVKTDIINADGNWVDKEVVVDMGWSPAAIQRICQHSAPRSSRNSRKENTAPDISQTDSLNRVSLLPAANPPNTPAKVLH
jgi:putative intracellular protease/amidase